MVETIYLETIKRERLRLGDIYSYITETFEPVRILTENYIVDYDGTIIADENGVKLTF